MSDEANLSIERAAARVGRYRWVIVALLFAATAINYIDRQMIGLLKPTMMDDPLLHMDERTYADIVVWFQVAYAIGYLGFGKVVDAIGARLGYAAAVMIWTIAPTLLPALNRPIAKARSFCGNHWATVLMPAGKLPDSPMPRPKRASANWVTL